MKPILPLALLLAASPAAQSLTSPAGHERREGNDRSAFPLSTTTARFQQIDATLRGKSFQIRGLALRRDGDPFTVHEAAATALRASLLLGYGQVSEAGPDFDRNHRRPPTTVLRDVKVDLPQWTGRSTSTPAAFDVRLPLPQPWLFDGTGDLLVELAVHAHPNAGGRMVDADDQKRSSWPIASKGPGCHGPLGLEMRTYSVLDSFGPGSRFSWFAGFVDGPPNAPAVVLVGTGPAPVPPRPPCEPDPTLLYPLPLFDLPLPATDARGVTSARFDWPHASAAIGLRLLVQGMAVDKTLLYGVRLGSYGDVVIPGDPGAVATRMLFAADDRAARAGRVADGGVILGLDAR